MGTREDTPMEIYKRGKNVTNRIEAYTKLMDKSNDEDKEILKEKILKLNDVKESIKDELYEEAKKKSGLDYSKKEKNPELLRKEYNEELADLKKRKQELKLERIRLEKIDNQKKIQMENEFEIASEKYKQMLDAGKITKELYESRVANMKEAKLKDSLEFGDKLHELDEESNKLDSQINDVKAKLDELHKKESIYNEYGDVYYNLFGEILADRNKMDISKEKKEKEEEEKKPVKENSEPEKAGNAPQEKGGAASGGAPVQNSVKQEKEPEEKKEKEIIVTSKKMFKELYKKMKKGTITDNELNALAQTLTNPDNYDKYGITTGLVFNKAKKILKYQGAKTAKNIEKFLRENGSFNDDIKFDTSMEKDGVLSHEILNSWKDIDKKLTYTDGKFSVEEYIEKIEKYKADGNKLTKEQEEIFDKAISIKNSLGSYRKAINVNEDVVTSRKNEEHYKTFKEKHKAKSSRALPEGEKDDPGFIVAGKGFDLSGLVEKPSPAEAAEPTKPISKVKSKDKEL